MKGMSLFGDSEDKVGPVIPRVLIPHVSTMLQNEIPADRKPQAGTALALKAFKYRGSILFWHRRATIVYIQLVMIASVFESKSDNS
jgi:hypothetical protein